MLDNSDGDRESKNRDFHENRNHRLFKKSRKKKEKKNTHFRILSLFKNYVTCTCLCLFRPLGDIEK